MNVIRLENGGTDQDINAALAELNDPERYQKLTLIGTFELRNPVIIPYPDRLYVDASLAYFDDFNTPYAVQCNGQEDPTYTTSESVRHFKWVGGLFRRRGFGGEGLLVRGFRNATVKGVEFERYEKAIVFSGKDTLTYENCYFRECGYGFFNQVWVSESTPGGSIIGLTIQNCHYTPGARGIAFVRATETLSDVLITNNVVTMGSSDECRFFDYRHAHDRQCRQIQISRNHIEQRSGTFSPKDTVGIMISTRVGTSGTPIELVDISHNSVMNSKDGIGADLNNINYLRIDMNRFGQARQGKSIIIRNGCLNVDITESNRLIVPPSFRDTVTGLWKEEGQYNPKRKRGWVK